MELDIALKGIFDAERSLRSSEAINSPVILSEQMIRLTQYATAAEEKLAELERDFETETAIQLKERLIDSHMKVTQAEREVEIVLAKEKGQIKYLTRIIGAAWKQVGTIQSRINHLTREAQTNI